MEWTQLQEETLSALTYFGPLPLDKIRTKLMLRKAGYVTLRDIKNIIKHTPSIKKAVQKNGLVLYKKSN